MLAVGGIVKKKKLEYREIEGFSLVELTIGKKK